MTMSDEKPTICANLIFPILIRPIIHKVCDDNDLTVTINSISWVCYQMQP